MEQMSPKKRARKAYILAYRIVFSYLFLYAKKSLFGKTYYDKRMEILHQKNAERIKKTILEFPIGYLDICLKRNGRTLSLAMILLRGLVLSLIILAISLAKAAFLTLRP